MKVIRGTHILDFNLEATVLSNRHLPIHRIMFRFLISVIFLVGVSIHQVQALTCPSTIGKDTPINVTVPTTISIDKTVGVVH